MSCNDPPRPVPETQRGGKPEGRRRFRAADLFAGTSEIVIEHQDADYRLRVTSNGKLILTR